MIKPKIAFFDFASCEGCQLALLNCEDILLSILSLVDLVEFREAISEKAAKYDIAFVEGSIHREEDAERLKDIRSRTAYLVALGACACNGNVQARSNFVSPAANYTAVYGKEARDLVQTDKDHWHLWTHSRVRALSEVVKVDFELRGCPMVPAEFLHLVKSLLSGSLPYFPPQAVCVECKKNENECVYDQGRTCMGQITFGGCNSICVNKGYVCDGCRGLLPNANIEAHLRLLKERGLTPEGMKDRYRLFCSTDEIQRGLNYNASKY